MSTPEIVHTPMAECYVENGILHLELTNGHLTLELIQAHFDIMEQQPGNWLSLPSILFVSSMRSFNKEARDLVSKTTEAAGTPCSAIIMQSTLAKVLVNLFLQINRPAFPTKIFTNKEKATQWIQEIVAAKK